MTPSFPEIGDRPRISQCAIANREPSLGDGGEPIRTYGSTALSELGPIRWRRQTKALDGSPSRVRRFRRVILLALVALLLLPSVILPGPSVVGAPPASPLGSTIGARISGAPSPANPPAGGSMPTLNLTGTFFTNTSAFSQVSPLNESCVNGVCESESADPSLVRLADGEVGVGFDLTSDYTTSTCPAAVNQTNGLSNVTVQVGFSVSSDGGKTFDAPHLIANATCPPYFQELQPSFAASSTTVYGTFVESNASPTEFGPGLFGWSNDPYDALGFVTIQQNGTVYSPIQLLSIAGTGDLARPQIAVFGETVYIVYFNTSADAAPFNSAWCSFFISGWGLSGCQAAYAHLIYSTDGGSTWQGPFLLPGVSPASLTTTTDAALSVAPDGTLAVAYTVNSSCVAWCGLNLAPLEGYEIEVATSTSNGSTWSASTVANDVIQALPPWAAAGALNAYIAATPSEWADAPQVAVAWGSNSDLYVSWNGVTPLILSQAILDVLYVPDGCAAPPAGSFDLWLCLYYEEDNTGLWFASSANAGQSWTTTTLYLPTDIDPSGDAVTQFSGAWNPAIGTGSGGQVWVTYTNVAFGDSVVTATLCGPNYGGSPLTGVTPPPGRTYAYGYVVQELAISNNQGANWTATADPIGAFLDPSGTLYPATYYSGFSSAVLTNGSEPILAYSLPTDVVNPDAATYVAIPYTGPVRSLQFDQNGLPDGMNWSAAVNGFSLNTTASQVAFAAVPAQGIVFASWSPANVTAGPDARLYASSSSGLVVNVSETPRVYLNWTLFYGVAIHLQPPGLGSLESANVGITGALGSVFWEYSWSFYTSCSFTGACTSYTYGCPAPGVPWYLPAATTYSTPNVLTIQAGPLPVDYWFGNGTGSYTGQGPQLSFTTNGPINETGWFGTFGTNYSVDFSTTGLPVSSVYAFQFNGTNYTAPAGQDVRVSGLDTGVYTLGSVDANATTPGWEYFGTPSSGDPVAVPTFPNVVLNFSTLVDVAAAPGPVSFQAKGLGPGTPWSLSVNGTAYSSNSSWLNLSLKPGTYPITEFPAIDANGTEAFAPIASASLLSVTPGNTYSIVLQPTYRVSASATAGGTVTPSGAIWLAANATESFLATVGPNDTWGGWSGTGPGSYTGFSVWANVSVSGGPISETAIFYLPAQNTFNLTFLESGLPNGTRWTVDVDGQGYTSTSGTLVIPNAYACHSGSSLGHYTIAVPYVYDPNITAARFVPGPYAPSQCGGTITTIAFLPQYVVSLFSTPGGTISAHANSTAEPDSFWLFAGASVDVTAQAASGYRFTGWVGLGPGSYTGLDPLATVVPRGPVTETANFQPVYPPPPIRYTLSIEAVAGFPSGTAWTIELNGSQYTATGDWLNITGLRSGSYAFSAAPAVSSDDMAQYLPVNPPSQLTIISSNASLSLSYATEYWVSVSSVGGGSTTPGSEFVQAGQSVRLTAVAGSGSLFRSWNGSGVGSYTGANATPSIVVVGPLVEVASFTVIRAAATTTTSAPGFYDTPAAWGAFGVIGLVVGLAVGMVLLRRRDAGNPPEGSSDAPAGEAPGRPTPADDGGIDER